MSDTVADGEDHRDRDSHRSPARVVQLWTPLADDPSNGSAVTQMLARMAIWTNNPDAVERWQGLYWDNVVHGGAPEADRVAYEAALYGLRGDRSGATTRYREALRRYRELRLDLDEAMMAIDMVYVLGPADPLTKEVVARARTTFAANHARAFLDQLDAALAHGAHEAAGQVAPSRQAREAGVPTT